MEDIGDFVVLKQLVTLSTSIKIYIYIYIFLLHIPRCLTFQKKKCQLTWKSKGKEGSMATNSCIVLPKIIALPIKGTKIDKKKM